MKIDDAEEIKNTDIANELKLPPVKLHCSMLAEDAIKAAIKDYKSKNAHITSKEWITELLISWQMYNQP